MGQFSLNWFKSGKEKELLELKIQEQKILPTLMNLRQLQSKNLSTNMTTCLLLNLEVVTETDLKNCLINTIQIGIQAYKTN